MVRALLIGLFFGLSVPTNASDDPGIPREDLERPEQGYSLVRRSGFRRSANRFGTHYFLGTSTIPLAKGEGWYKNTLVSLNSATFALTEHLAVGASIDVVSLVTSRANGPVWNTRMQVSGSLSDNVHIGASAVYLSTRLPVAEGAPVPATDVPNGFGAGMGMCTLGNADNQLTVAAGWTHDGQSAGKGPLLHVAGAVRLFPNAMLVTEHWLLAEPQRSFAIHSAGIRVIGENLAIDIGLAYDKELTVQVTPVGLPFVAATLNF